MRNKKILIFPLVLLTAFLVHFCNPGKTDNDREAKGGFSDFFPKKRNSKPLTLKEMKIALKTNGRLFDEFWLGMNIYEIEDLIDLLIKKDKIKVETNHQSLLLEFENKTHFVRFAPWVISLDEKKFQANENKVLSSLSFYLIIPDKKNRQSILALFIKRFNKEYGRYKLRYHKQMHGSRDSGSARAAGSIETHDRSKSEGEPYDLYYIWETDKLSISLRQNKHDLVYPQINIRDKASLGKTETPARVYMPTR